MISILPSKIIWTDYYKKLYAVLNRRYEAAIKLNITLENKAMSKVAQEKRKSFDESKTKEG
jgi:hypothetical protein